MDTGLSQAHTQVLELQWWKDRWDFPAVELTVQWMKSHAWSPALSLKRRYYFSEGIFLVEESCRLLIKYAQIEICNLASLKLGILTCNCRQGHSLVYTQNCERF